MAEAVISWRQLVAEATDRFSNAGIAEPETSARRLAEEASGFAGAELPLHLDDAASNRGVAQFDAMVTRRMAGEPIQYVVGRWGFRYLDLFVDRRVLIPRPETEVVAEYAIKEATRLSAQTRSAQTRRVTVADLGTGSGAIGLSVASEVPHSDVWLTDASPEALAVARANLAGLGRAGSRVTVAEGDWFNALPADSRGLFGVIVSNPPYVAESDQVGYEVTEWEPHGALFAGPEGTLDLELLIASAGEWLEPQGALVLEIGSTQGEWAAQFADQFFAVVSVHPDLSGSDRVLVARSPRS